MFKENSFIKHFVKYTFAMTLYMFAMYISMVAFISIVAHFNQSVLTDIGLQLFLLAITSVFIIIDLVFTSLNKRSVGYIIFNKIFKIEFSFLFFFEELNNIVRAYDVSK